MQNFSRKNLKKLEYIVITTIVLFVALIAATAVFTGMEDVLAQASKVSFGTIAILLFCSLINYGLRGLRWHFFGQKLDIPVPPARIALYYTAGFALSTTPGKVGTAVRLWLLNRIHGHAYSKTTPMMFMDQLTDFIAIFALSAIGFTAYGNASQTWAMLLLAALVTCVCLAFAYPNFLKKLLQKLNTLTNQKLSKLTDFTISTLDNLRQLFSPKLFTATILLSIIGWGAEGYAFHLIMQTLGHDIGLGAAMFIFGFSSLVGGLSMLPGGLGTAEATMFGLLLLIGIPAEVAVAATAIIRFTTLWFGVALGFIALPFALKLAKR